MVGGPTITAVGVADITGSVELLVNGSTFLTGNLGPPGPGDAFNAFIFITNALPPGTDTVQPMYGGNEIYSSSFGVAVPVTVNAAHRRCWPARPDLGERWPSRLVATAEEDRLNIRRNPHTSFAAASDCRTIAINGQSRR
jgi:hypothetical protein